MLCYHQAVLQTGPLPVERVVVSVEPREALLLATFVRAVNRLVVRRGVRN